MPGLLSGARTVENLTAEQVAVVYRDMADQNFRTVGGSVALDRVGDPYAAAALHDTVFWEGAHEGALTIEQAINDVAGRNAVPEDSANGRCDAKRLCKARAKPGYARCIARCIGAEANDLGTGPASK